MSGQFTPNVSGDLYAYSLGAWMRSYRLYDPDFSLIQDPDAYYKLRKDAVVAHSIEYRKHLVAGRDWYLEPASDHPVDRRAATVMESLLRKIKRFAEARFHLSEAVIRGSAWARIYGERQVIRIGDDVNARPWYVVTRLQDASKMRFRQIRIDGRAPDEASRWRWELHQGEKNEWKPIVRGHWVRHVYDSSEDTLGYGRGLAEALYYYWSAKAQVLEYGLQFLDRWANGMIQVGIDSLRAASVGTGVGPNSDDRTAVARANAWVTAIDQMRRKHVLAYDKADELKVTDAPQGGWKATTDALSYFDGAMIRLVVGSLLPTGGGAGDMGSYARAQVEENSTEALVGYDQNILEETIDEDVISLLWRANQQPLREIGLASATQPHFRLRPAQPEDFLRNAQLLGAARQQVGLELRRDEAYSKLGLTAPAAGDEVIGGNAPMPIPGAEQPNPLPTPMAPEEGPVAAQRRGFEASALAAKGIARAKPGTSDHEAWTGAAIRAETGYKLENLVPTDLRFEDGPQGVGGAWIQDKLVTTPRTVEALRYYADARPGSRRLLFVSSCEADALLAPKTTPPSAPMRVQSFEEEDEVTRKEMQTEVRTVVYDALGPLQSILTSHQSQQPPSAGVVIQTPSVSLNTQGDIRFGGEGTQVSLEAKLGADHPVNLHVANQEVNVAVARGAVQSNNTFSPTLPQTQVNVAAPQVNVHPVVRGPAIHVDVPLPAPQPAPVAAPSRPRRRKVKGVDGNGKPFEFEIADD